ncbi:AraC family transcriptional regulator [Promicromonospora panici]|uniref:AraC family transcriptional regulator n=1 Tax=Promicromonospora panici TaxID=2219658 RepID=UPI00101CE7D5|nr:AraC family transcriptional regulator [Promicromonospora panici]
MSTFEGTRRPPSLSPCHCHPVAVPRRCPPSLSPVAERIARQVSFPTPSNFRALFRRATGVTPRAYRTTFRPTAPAV